MGALKTAGIGIDPLGTFFSSKIVTRGRARAEAIFQISNKFPKFPGKKNPFAMRMVK
jgi:hypothetical protein